MNFMSGMHENDEYGAVSERATRSKGDGAVSGHLPWLETVAPRRVGEQPDRVRFAMMPLLGSVPIESVPMEMQQDAAFGLAALIHDTRNMVTAMELYCDLLEEPGVLATPFRHYANELRLVGGAGRRLLQRLSATTTVPAYPGPVIAGEKAIIAQAEKSEPASTPAPTPSLVRKAGPIPIPVPVPATVSAASRGRMLAFAAGEPIESLADELRANRNLLSALAGAAVTVGLVLRGAEAPIAMTREDLTRVLVNLTKNAAEAMPGGGHIQIELEEIGDVLSLTFTDTGTGIPPGDLEAIFSPGYTTHVNLHPDQDADVTDLETMSADSELSRSRVVPGAWPVQHRGLGLTIVRSIVAAAGGSAWAANRRDCRGAIIILEFPLRSAVDAAEHMHSSADSPYPSQRDFR
jgi:signal transduction histidine kinase